MAKRKNVLKSTSELTLKQKAFVDIYVSNWGEITKVEAARRAGYKSNKPEGPTEIASRLTDPNKNPHVVRYMEMKYNQELKKHEGDKLKKYKRFETLSKKAEDKKQYAVAVNAEFRSGQMAGRPKNGSCSRRTVPSPNPGQDRTLAPDHEKPRVVGKLLSARRP